MLGSSFGHYVYIYGAVLSELYVHFQYENRYSILEITIKINEFHKGKKIKYHNSIRLLRYCNFSQLICTNCFVCLYTTCNNQTQIKQEEYLVLSLQWDNLDNLHRSETKKKI